MLICISRFVYIRESSYTLAFSFSSIFLKINLSLFIILKYLFIYLFITYLMRIMFIVHTISCIIYMIIVDASLNSSVGVVRVTFDMYTEYVTKIRNMVNFNSLAVVSARAQQLFSD